MSPATQRTLYRFLGVFLAAGAGDALIQFFNAGTYDWRHLLAALGAAFIVALEKWLAEINAQIAAPTVQAASLALQEATGNPLASVPPPKVRVEPATVVTMPPEPRKPFDTL